MLPALEFDAREEIQVSVHWDRGNLWYLGVGEDPRFASFMAGLLILLMGLGVPWECCRKGGLGVVSLLRPRLAAIPLKLSKDISPRAFLARSL
jgi:hypothetical protein